MKKFVLVFALIAAAYYIGVDRGITVRNIPGCPKTQLTPHGTKG